MYTEIHKWKDFEQKVLYFKLNNVLNLQEHNELNRKIAGVYAIFKDDICLYVGQSINLASRIATHLKGKYETSTELYLWNVENIGFSDFYERSKDSQNIILDNCEKYLMSKLKPIENLLIDMNFTLDENKTPEIDLNNYSCFSLKIDENYLTVVESDSISESISKMYEKIEVEFKGYSPEQYDDIYDLLGTTDFSIHTKKITNTKEKKKWTCGVEK